MSRIATFAAGAAILCGAISSRTASGEDLQQERAAVRDQLSAERAALTAAREKKVQPARMSQRA